MKKIASMAVASLILLQLLIPSYAASDRTEISNEGSTSMQISTTATAEYILSFPADVVIPWESATSTVGTVKAEKLLIAPSMAVQVQVNSQNGYALVHDTSRIPYALLVDKTDANSMAFYAGEYGKTKQLDVTVQPDAWAKAASGTHQDKLTFVVSYVAKNSI